MGLLNFATSLRMNTNILKRQFVQFAALAAKFLQKNSQNSYNS